MRLVSYEPSQQMPPRGAIVVARDGDQPRQLVDLGVAASVAGEVVRDASVRSFLTLRPDSRTRIADAAFSLTARPELVIETTGLRLVAPIPDPGKIVCLGLNYSDHALEAGLEPPPAPLLFAKYTNALVGPTGVVPLPPRELTDQVDYEGELAVVIGSPALSVGVEEALSHVAGYMVMNDVSARDLQVETGQWLAGKSLDGFAPCGPALVTPDELDDPSRLTILTRVNGVTVQDGSTGDMIFDVAEAISFISHVLSLDVGDVIATGTPGGVGSRRTPPLFMSDGDVVEVEIPGIGVICNRHEASTQPYRLQPFKAGAR